MSLEKIEKLDSTLSSMKIDNSTLGLLTFKISKYGMKKESNVIFHSEPFHNSSRGCKMWIRVDPNGDGEAQDSHVSVFLKLLEAPNDESMHWPFVEIMKFEILNQLEDNGHYV